MNPARVLPYGRHSISDEDITAVVDCLRGDWLTQGPRVRAFEDDLCAYTGAKYAVAVSSGTAALHLVYRAAGVGPGHVGLTSPISFVATANALLHNGAKVAFADISPESALLEPPTLERRIRELEATNQKPRVVVPVHFAGQPSDARGIQQVAREHGALVIEDAAHALGAKYSADGTTHTVGSCAHADASIFSFHAVKHVAMGEGGAVTTNDEGLSDAIRELRSHGLHKEAGRFDRSHDDPMVGPWYYEQDSLGFNYRVTDLQCALGTSQLRRLDGFVARREAIARRYDAAIHTHRVLSATLSPLATSPGIRHARHLYVVRLCSAEGEFLGDVAGRRKQLHAELHRRGILVQVHYIPIPWQPYFRRNPLVIPGAVPVAEAYYAACLSLPIYPAMTDDDVEFVLQNLVEAIEKEIRR